MSEAIVGTAGRSAQKKIVDPATPGGQRHDPFDDSIPIDARFEGRRDDDAER